jgi:hypothetical protein
MSARGPSGCQSPGRGERYRSGPGPRLSLYLNRRARIEQEVGRCVVESIMSEPHPQNSTLGDVRPASAGPRPVRGRSILVAALLLIVTAGAAGLFGVRTTTNTATGGGYEVSVEYAWIARAGLDVPWTVTVHRAGGFTGPISLAVTGDYFDIYESQGLDPEPAAQSADAEFLYWTFDPPPAGEDFTIDFDAYIQPASQWGASGEVRLLEDATPVVTVPFTTALVP